MANEVRAVEPRIEREVVGDRYGARARQARQLLRGLAVKVNDLRVFPVLARWQLYAERQQILRVESGIDCDEPCDTPDHEPGADQKDECERDLRDDERGASATVTAASGVAAPGLFKHLVCVRARCLKRG